mmetsp:Transcript_25506/g.46120  ORF Transcript_25506/g.46120 Transcript_25506/m.46120 type:complete len:152 (-) Transcript_25506:1151-1606(-)
MQMGKIRMSLTGPQAANVFNNLIRGTHLQELLFKFQRVRHPESMSLGSCGLTWWKGFKKRHADKIVTKRGERFASCRADWTKKLNLAQMYDVIYDVMLEARIASKQPVRCRTWNGTTDKVFHNQPHIHYPPIHLRVRWCCLLCRDFHEQQQ